MAVTPHTNPRSIPAFEHSRNAGDSKQPTLQAIREKAYEIYKSRKGQPGNAEVDWCEAERALRQQV